MLGVTSPSALSPAALSLTSATTVKNDSWLRTLLRFIGPGIMIAVGYMDPGNWATDLSGGSTYHYNLLFAVLFSSLVAMLLQTLSVKLGLVTGRDLAQLCREQFHPAVSIVLYITAECAIIATDLAEVIGAAIAMNLLFKLPLAWGVAITGLDVLIILLGFGPKYLRWFEYFVMTLVGTIGVLFIAMLAKIQPNWGDVFAGYVPRREIFADGGQLFLFMGIVGATVMPHNLYLHTHLIQYRYSHLMPLGAGPMGSITVVPAVVDISYNDRHNNDNDTEGNHDNRSNRAAKSPRNAVLRHNKAILPITLKYCIIDCLLSLTFALFVNSAILIVASASFYTTGNRTVATIPDAYNLLGTLVSPAFSVIFGVALLCSGQSSTITGTIAGQVVMGGFLGSDGYGNRFLTWMRKPWLRRLVSRSLAILPAMTVVLVQGADGLDSLLIISQVVLSVQLPFAMWPLVWFTSKKALMTLSYEEDPFKPGPDTVSYANSRLTAALAFTVAFAITGLNIVMLIALARPDLIGSN
ncbi:hypothetical protein HDU87_005528 [Geranomyces variabilis]|uniref:Uncharacterized protein n=1 Tax=Geranomyces variabilis TaxID=109894 RepID=A0AAD5THI8_9FUNG|nr:hypothetical protein HDU87_005528 [Geranomyces variabilis]